MTRSQINLFALQARAAQSALYDSLAMIGGQPFACHVGTVSHDRSAADGGFAPDAAAVAYFAPGVPVTSGSRVTIEGTAYRVARVVVSQLTGEIRAELIDPATGL